MIFSFITLYVLRCAIRVKVENTREFVWLSLSMVFHPVIRNDFKVRHPIIPAIAFCLFFLITPFVMEKLFLAVSLIVISKCRHPKRCKYPFLPAATMAVVFLCGKIQIVPFKFWMIASTTLSTKLVEHVHSQYKKSAR